MARFLYGFIMILPKDTIRLILSVAAGIATAMVLSTVTHEILHLCGVFPPLSKPMFDTQLVIISLIYHSLFAVAGAFVTAKFAKEKARRAVLILGSKEAIMWLLGTLLLWEHAPAWYNITKALLGIPLALLGGWIYSHFYTTKIKKEQATSVR